MQRNYMDLCKQLQLDILNDLMEKRVECEGFMGSDKRPKKWGWLLRALDDCTLYVAEHLGEHARFKGERGGPSWSNLQNQLLLLQGMHTEQRAKANEKPDPNFLRILGETEKAITQAESALTQRFEGNVERDLADLRQQLEMRGHLSVPRPAAKSPVSRVFLAPVVPRNTRGSPPPVTRC